MTESTHNCPFCSLNIESEIVERLGNVIAIKDKHPVSKGHVLVLPIRHILDFLSMSSEEKNNADRLIRNLCHKIKKSDSTVTGFNIGVNCGKSAGQSIMHAHIHLIPRRDGDTPKPKGGVRGVIPNMMGY
jgi:diadenosine tetraphosphate (Ap4A) HIT family hydrolase